MTTLLIDDEEFALRLTAHQLTSLGMTDVVAHHDPRAALALLEAGTPAFDLIVLDLQMPDLDGVEFMRHLARLNYRGRLVLLSGEDPRILQTADRLARAHTLDVLGTLHKPVTPEALRALLSASSGGRARSAAVETTYAPERLAQAIERGELVNMYQPKVTMATGQLDGVETLVRWRHPDDGLVFPDRFIALAEQHGLIDALTRTVLRNAVTQARSWEEDGLELRVAVNVSMDNLWNLDFPDYIAGELKRAGVPVRDMILEITESRLMRDPLAALDILTRLRLKHVELSIDDFGTGHSSLTQLRDIPFDELKIDRSFVHGAKTNPENHAIVAASLALAKELGLRTVAEGIEDRDDWDCMRDLGCDLAQGYLIAKPMFASALIGWLADWNVRRVALGFL